MHLKNGNGPASDGNRMCVAWLNELPLGCELTRSKWPMTRRELWGPLPSDHGMWITRKNDVERTMRGTSSKGNQEDDRCQDRLDKSEQ